MGLKKMPASDVKHLVVHCSATKADQNFHAADIDRWHRAQGWSKIGYHYVITRDGTTEKGRLDDEPGAHAHGVNTKSLGICMVGGIDKDGKPEDNFTDDQKNSLYALLTQLAIKFNDPTVLGHRDLPGVNKACPSFDVRAWLKTRTA